MDCKQAQILLIPHIMGDLHPDSVQFHELEAHLASCQTCLKEYVDLQRTIGFIVDHKAEFTEAIEPASKQATKGSLPGLNWHRIEAGLKQIDAKEKEQRRTWQLMWRIAAAAACFFIVISVWLALQDPEKRCVPREVAENFQHYIRGI